mmetsp:Transcript_13589/g.14927  ORF Transcript_13589/g.14927 Transcript_13589/m.14927 type:complete len:427 (-) Transcript_13589:241-1521(-)
MLNMNKNMSLSASLISRYLVVVSLVAIAIAKTASLTVDAFVVVPLSTSITPSRASTSTRSTSTSPTSLFAVSALVRKAKEEELRTQLQKANGKLDETVMEQYKLIQQDVEKENSNDQVGTGPGKLQSNLIKRKGTITVIAEYKRKIADGANGYLNVNVNDSVTPSSSSTDNAKLEANSPELLSGEFREFGAAGIAVLADERMGGCTYEDLYTFVTEQRTASSDVPGSVPIINSDIIVDEIQLAQSAALGVSAIVLDYELLASTEGLFLKLAKAARAVDLELIVAVRSKEEAQHSIDVIVNNCQCSFMLSVVQTEGVDAKYDIIKDLDLSPSSESGDNVIQITTIANILHRNDQGLAEVEETWALRDMGFQCAWISDALYKAGNSNTEHPGAIIQSMGAKSSTRWASPVAKSGRGEGAKEYLGDILM